MDVEELLVLNKRAKPSIRKADRGISAAGGRIFVEEESWEVTAKISVRVTTESESLQREITFLWHSNEDLVVFLSRTNPRVRDQLRKLDSQISPLDLDLSSDEKI